MIMRKIGIINYHIVVLFLCATACNPKKDLTRLQVKKLDNYSSASSIEYYDGNLYIMGDDAPNLLVLDTNLTIVDSIPILSYPGKRIPKDIKPDLEGSVLYNDGTGHVLILFGSGSLPQRSVAVRYHIETKMKDSISLKSLYSKIKDAGIQQINIEGACILNKSLILTNRGNKSYPKNQLVITDKEFWNNDSSFQIKIIPVISKADTTSFSGISGFCYAAQNDKLIMTVSTEDTRSSFTDGPIGKSFLWIINTVSSKLNDLTITPDKIIDLEKIDVRFKNQKIEAATVINETNELIQLALVADNDDGSSTVFKMRIKKD
jgi:hypothetical protein